MYSFYSPFNKILILKLNQNISSIIQKYLLSSEIGNKKLFDNNIKLLQNIRNLLFIDTLDDNFKPSFLKKPYVRINKTNIWIDEQNFKIYLNYYYERE